MKTLLVLMDDHGAEDLEQLFVDQFYETRKVTDPAEAFDLARSYSPDLVVAKVDGALSEAGGLCRRMRADPLLQGVPVLLYVADDTCRDLDPQVEAPGELRIVEQSEDHAQLLRVADQMAARRYLALQGSETADTALQDADALTRALGRRVRQLEAQKAAGESQEERFRDFAEISADWFWEADADLNYVHISDRFAEATGLDSKDYIGTSLLDFPCGRDDADTRRLQDSVLNRRESFKALICIYETPAGGTGYISMSGKPLLDQDGAFCCYRGTGREVTERHAARNAVKESEQRFRQLAENIRDVVWLAEPNGGRVLYVNGMYERTLGISREILFANRNAFLDSVVKEDLPKVMAALPKRNDGRLDETFRIRHPDGSVRWLHARMFPVLGVSGEVIRVAGIATDITEQIAQREELVHSQKTAALGQLTTGIAHDFNNLLAVLLGNLELAQETLGPDNDAEDFISGALDATRRGAELTGRLLSFARKQGLKAVPTDVGDLAIRMQHLLARVLGDAITIEARRPPDLWTCRVDPAQTEQAILNLAINARDAMPDGGTLDLLVSNMTVSKPRKAVNGTIPAGDYVMICVRDSGTGMNPADRKRIFDPYFTTKDMGKGTGLGLSIVYGFTDQSGGFIDVQSEIGRGTEFCLYFPRIAKAPPENARPAPVRHATPKEQARILLVEDEPDVRKVLVRALGSLQYDVIEAENVKQALEKWSSSGPFDLVLTDLMLPRGGNGLDLVRTLKSQAPGTRFLAMSGYGEGLSDAQDGQIQDIHFLQKPFTRQALAKKLTAVLSG